LEIDNIQAINQESIEYKYKLTRNSYRLRVSLFRI